MTRSLLPVEFHWQSTPRLWAAVREGYDGALDSRCPMGFGRTKEEAEADLIEREEPRCKVCGMEDCYAHGA